MGNPHCYDSWFLYLTFPQINQCNFSSTGTKLWSIHKHEGYLLIIGISSGSSRLLSQFWNALHTPQASLFSAARPHPFFFFFAFALLCSLTWFNIPTTHSTMILWLCVTANVTRYTGNSFALSPDQYIPTRILKLARVSTVRLAVGGSEVAAMAA